MPEQTMPSVPLRNAQVDFLRLLAVVLVLCFHFKECISWGFLGVDVFFVLSGYLVSKPLITAYVSNEPIRWLEFAIKRFFKIVPSYIFFLVVASVIARIWIMPQFPLEVILRSEYIPFLLLYVNYTGTLAWIFGHIWSLCIEEHFYILLPLLFLLSQVLRNRLNRNVLVFLLVSLIFLTVVLRVLGHWNNWDTFAKTHMRIDALVYGVLIALLESVNKLYLLKRWAPILFILSLTLLILGYFGLNSLLYRHIVLHTLVPVCIGSLLILMLAFKPPVPALVTNLASYSYNWYLWHPIIAFVLIEMTDLHPVLKFVCYLIASFGAAFIATKLVELPFLKLRSWLIKKLPA